jgi:serine/threonine protein kinase
LKPENLLVGADGYLKLADFGHSQFDMSNLKGSRQKLGTPEYIAPEILKE